MGAFTPGPILMVAAYVGYKVVGIAGAMVGTAAIFLPSFILMLAILPVFHRVRTLVWGVDEGGDARHRTGSDRRACRLSRANGTARSSRPVCDCHADCDCYHTVGVAHWRSQNHDYRFGFRCAAESPACASRSE